MRVVTVRIYSQEGRDAEGRLQSHQWAELPAELAGRYLSGGLKRIRRLTESYFAYRFWPAASRVRGAWRSGEPHLMLQFWHVPGLHGRLLLHLGRLRSTGTLDVYRGYHEIRGGEMLSPAARLASRPWPADMPWVAPSAGEFSDAERQRESYYGIFEIRVQRTRSGCLLHTTLIDFPLAEGGLRASLWSKPWQPMRRAANLAFLHKEIETSAREKGYEVRFEIQDLPGLPERARFRVGAASHATPA
jgi:hypothetical protein